MKQRKTWLGILLGLVVLAGILWSQRLLVLQYSLGWYADIRHPRQAWQPVPWQAGPQQATATPAARPPNVIVILADDLGINDVGAHGGGRAAEGVPTPAIDSIAAAGVRFDNGYAGSAVCTVSRAALLTGRYPWRFGVEFTPLPGAFARVAGALYNTPQRIQQAIVDQAAASNIKDFNELGMPDTEVTLAELLKARGYHTVHIGKWHLGSTPTMRPNNQGFDETLFMESGLYLPQNHPDAVNSKQDFDPIDQFLWPNMRYGVSFNGGTWFEPKRYLTDYFTDEAVNVIRNNRHRPFFLYLAHWGVHTPLQASRADYDALSGIPDHRRRVYGAMIRAVDRSVERVLQTLKEEGLLDNTLVIFSSDNGAPSYIGLPEVNQPYRGWKLTFFEGGIRVPFVAQWPAKIAPGTRYSAPVSHMDLTPTAVAAAGGTVPTDRQIDGVNLLPFLMDTSVAQPARALHWRDGPLRSVQEKGWKLIRSARPQKDWLFDLNRDPTERQDLSNSEPAKLAELRTLMEKHHADMPKPLWSSVVQTPIFIDKTMDRKEEPSDTYTYWYN